MNLRWLLFDYADPDLPLSFWKRQKIAWRLVLIWKLPRSARRGRIVFVLAFAVPQILVVSSLPRLIDGFANAWFAGTWPLAIVALAVALWIWGCILYGLLSRAEHYHRIRLEGFDICLKCGYWLRGLAEDVTNCPECGTKREPMPGAEAE